MVWKRLIQHKGKKAAKCVPESEKDINQQQTRPGAEHRAQLFWACLTVAFGPELSLEVPPSRLTSTKMRNTNSNFPKMQKITFLLLGLLHYCLAGP